MKNPWLININRTIKIMKVTNKMSCLLDNKFTTKKQRHHLINHCIKMKFISSYQAQTQNTWLKPIWVDFIWLMTQK